MVWKPSTSAPIRTVRASDSVVRSAFWGSVSVRPHSTASPASAVQTTVPAMPAPTTQPALAPHVIPARMPTGTATPAAISATVSETPTKRAP